MISKWCLRLKIQSIMCQPIKLACNHVVFRLLDCWEMVLEMMINANSFLLLHEIRENQIIFDGHSTHEHWNPLSWQIYFNDVLLKSESADGHKILQFPIHWHTKQEDKTYWIDRRVRKNFLNWSYHFVYYLHIPMFVVI